MQPTANQIALRPGQFLALATGGQAFVSGGTAMIGRMFMAGVIAITLPGCATLRGAQDPLPELRPTTAAETMTSALRNFASNDASLRQGLSRQDYRDLIIRDYSQRIEAKYNGFVEQLWTGDRSTALGFDFLQLGLAAATGFVKPDDVEEFAAASTVAAGARASVDKRVFYDRTITALVATMDGERADIKADIARKRRLPATEYSLNDAFDDLNRLADAGNINRAFSRLNRNAEAEKAAAQQRLDGISAACDDIGADDAQRRRDFRLFLDASQANIAAAAAEMELDLVAGQDPKALLRDALANDYCGAAKKKALLEKLGVGGY